MENNFIQMAAWLAMQCPTRSVQYLSILLCVAVFHQLFHEYCPLKHQLSLACRRNTYNTLWCQIAAPRWPNDISSAADNATLKTSVASAVWHVAQSC